MSDIPRYPDVFLGCPQSPCPLDTTKEGWICIRCKKFGATDKPPYNPFTPNGCSGFMTRAWRFIVRHDPPWEGCCDQHDIAYSQGGDADDRRRADLQLRFCVDQNGHRYWAWVMWVGVRLFGWAYWNAIKREQRTYMGR